MSANAPQAATDLAAGGLLNVLGSLILVLGLIFVLAWLLRRLQGVRAGRPGALRIHGGLQVGAKERVLLIQAGEQHLLIGVAAGQVRTLHVFERPPVPAQAEVATESSFAERLRQALTQDKTP